MGSRKPRKRATISDVALLAGVSISTVSRVINHEDPSQMRDVTRDRVLDAMAALDYTPVKAARDLRRRRTHVLALLVPDISNPFFSLLARGVEAAGFRVGYSTLICDSNNSKDEERQHMSALLRQNVDGVILVPVGRPDLAGLERMERSEVPVVTADRRIPGIPHVEADNAGGSRELAKRLVALGHRQVAYLGGPEDVSTAEDRLQGFLDGLAEGGVAPVAVRRGDFTYDSGVSLGTEILRDEHPDAVVAGNDLMAIGVLHAAAAAGRRVPEDLGVAGFDDIQWAALVRPRLTTVRVPFLEIGQCSARALVARIMSYDDAVEPTCLPVSLVIGDSTCAARAREDATGVSPGERFRKRGDRTSRGGSGA
ncbi:MAG: LacI family DNA-binding transcriptional regulator [Candidatus Bipolaricaulis sp.]|nr:LacI family DNA-binding transcriptional regulator [Candidatus Bipolaricaulis sp.]MDD5646331.1 LacI family DNA-binding transcriptional regulator [Candidatus Bipolaricaulis sp.]